jgi:hypothetical protein
MKLSFTQKRFLPRVVMPPIEPATNEKNTGGLDERGGVHLLGKRGTFFERTGNGFAACARLDRDDITGNEYAAASDERAKARRPGAYVRNGVILEIVPRC